MTTGTREQLNSSFNPTHEFELNVPFTGIYKETRLVEFKKGKKVMESKVHTFDVDGILTDVWGSAIIDKSIEKCKPGDKLEIVFTGKGETKDGNKLNKFDVFRL